LEIWKRNGKVVQYEKAGYNLPDIGGGLLARLFDKYPPGAQNLSDSNYSVSGWPVVPGPVQPGDLLAFRGHVGIATGPETSISASPYDGVVENKWGFRKNEVPVIRRCTCP
jgi:cell wall-associated NlpC family hydrolase